MKTILDPILRGAAIVSLSLLSSVASAADVSPADAGRAAQAWVDRGYALGKLPPGIAVAGVERIEDAATGVRLHVAKLSGGGFVVLSADDLVDPVIAFSTSGEELDLDEENPLWTLLRSDVAARESAAGVERGGAVPTSGAPSAGKDGAGAASAPTAAQLKWAGLLADGHEGNPPADGNGVSTVSDVRVDSFVLSSWNQKTHNNASSGVTCYNYYTPNNTYCGCTPTAFSQIMRYYRFPTASVTPKTYTCQIDGTSTDKTMMGGVYAWDDMPLEPWKSTPTETQRQAIGKLTYDMGVVSCANWRSNGTGASIHLAAIGLKEDFGYASAVSFYYCSSYPFTLDEFKKAVIPSLDARSPVVLDIYSESREAGHAIFADGYGYSGGDFYLHLNFGWGSRSTSYNVWYCPPELNASDTKTYDTIRGIVFNIFPTASGNVMSGRVLEADGTPAAGVTVYLDDGPTSTTTDERGVYAFVTSAGTHKATASRSGAEASVSAKLSTMVPTRFVGRPSNGYYKTACVVGNSGNNDIVLPAPVLDPPVLASIPADGVAPLAFGGTSASPTFEVRVRNATAGLWYTVYATADLADDFLAVLSTNAPSGGILPLRIDATDRTKFVRIGVGTGEVPNGTKLEP
jgi:hypothetical protein